MRALILLLIVCVAAPGVLGAEGAEHVWQFELPAAGGAACEIPIATDALRDRGAIELAWSLSGAVDDDAPDRWLELAILTSDGRWFTTASLPALHAGRGDRRRIYLQAADWAGTHGRLGGDALHAVSYWRLSVHGGQTATVVSGTITALPVSDTPEETVTLAVEQVGDGVIRRTANARERWQEWRLRLVGDARSESGTLRLVTDQGEIPAFFEQPGENGAHGWQPQGPGRWVFRLRSGEVGSRGHLEWRSGTHQWRSPLVQVPMAIDKDEPLPEVHPDSLPIDRVPAWEGPAAVLVHGSIVRTPPRAVDAAFAPVLRWRADWTGFRGLDATAHAQAQAWDAQLAQPVTTVDLLSDALVQEQGAFRFGLHPHHHSSGGACAYPQDWWSAAAAAEAWIAHAQDVVARTRAVPELTTWTMGCLAPANNGDQLARLHRIASAIADVATIADERPVLLRHPQLLAYRYRANDPPWSTFERHTEGWGSAPWPGMARPQRISGGSEGDHALDLPLLTAGSVRIGAAQKTIDANVSNLDRLEWDLRFEGAADVAADCYAWVTDRHHRWYQIRVTRLSAAPRWTTIGVDLDSGAAWEPVGHDAPWTGDQRRQLRRLGIAVFVHGDHDGAATVRIDRIRRLGWPECLQPPLTIDHLQVTAEPTARATPIMAEFTLSQLVTNPFDPDVADVVGEVEGPDGQRLRYPAYWTEPMALHFRGGVETVEPAGAGRWHWRFSPPQPGVWRWRIAAKLKVQDTWQESLSPWHTSSVPATWPTLIPVRPDPQDPTWWRRDDGSFWYPLGLNLRSPGDSRQDAVLVAEAAGKAVPARDADPLTAPLPGWTSPQFERLGTVAFDRWFKRFAANGMTWARVWMCPWWCGLEWSREWDEYGGVLVYNQHAAARLDRVLESAAEAGIYVQLELQNHGMTSDFVDQQWNPDRRGNPGSPYSTRQGGPCRSPGEFYRSEDAWQLQAKRLRYIQARWGWRSGLAAFVLSSEMEFTGDWKDSGAYGQEDLGHAPETQRWIERNLAWFAANDPMQRAVSVHFSHPWRASRLWQMEGLGFSNSNAYTGFQEAQRRLGGPGAGLAKAFDIYLNGHFPPERLKRPTIIGEWGGHWERNTPARLAAELHTGLWMQAVLPYGGNTGFWWWLWIDAADTWHEYAAVARFVAGWDPRGVRWQSRRPLASPGVLALGMQSPREMRAYVWCEGFDRSLTVDTLSDAGTVTWRAPAGSTWTVECWDTTSGTVIATSQATTGEDGNLVVPLGELRGDAAFVLRRK